MVDVLDWYELTTEFRKLILSKFDVIQPGPEPAVATPAQPAPG
jgi:hypothetical protein